MVDICKLCSRSDFCKQQETQNTVDEICKHFTPKYNCNACSQQCGDDVLCWKFSPKDLILETNKSHPIEGVLWDLLSELMKIEKSTDSAITKFKQELEANGIKAVFTDRIFKTYINNLLALKTLDQLISSYGLGEFREQILKNEIDRIFKSFPEPSREQLVSPL